MCDLRLMKSGCYTTKKHEAQTRVYENSRRKTLLLHSAHNLTHPLFTKN